MSDQVRVNGSVLSKGSCSLKLGGIEPFFGWQTIEFGDKRERAYAFGAAPQAGPLGMTTGRYEPDPLVIGFFKHSVDGPGGVMERLAANALDGISAGNARVLWILTVTEPGVADVVEEFEGCYLTERSDSVEDSAEATISKLTFKITRRTSNNRTLYDASAA